jgi:glycosyltransferase involved in cell wall biosynthesis
MENMLVSVIIPVYNGERFLSQALKSVSEQDYSPFEVIVVDDGSTDKSLSIARSFGNPRCISQANRGNAAARNAGIEISTGDLIAFLDQDDLWTPNKLTIQARHMMGNPELLYTVARLRMFLEEGCAPPVWFKKELLQGDHIGYSPGTLMARRSAFDIIGNFNTDLSMTSDVEWFAKAKDMKIPMAVIQEVLLKYRIHSANQSSRASAYHPEMLKVIREKIQRRKKMELRRKE